MARRKKIVSAPLPQRKGVDPVRLKLPVTFPQEYKVSGSVPSLADYLIARFYSHRPDYVFDLLERGEIVDDDGVPLTAHTPLSRRRLSMVLPGTDCRARSAHRSTGTL